MDYSARRMRPRCKSLSLLPAVGRGVNGRPLDGGRRPMDLPVLRHSHGSISGAAHDVAHEFVDTGPMA